MGKVKATESDAQKVIDKIIKRANKKFPNKVDPKELLSSLPGRGRTNNPPVPKKNYDYEWCVYATDDFLKQSLTDYMNQKHLGECRQIRYKKNLLDVYPMTPEGVDFVKEKIRSLGIKKSIENFILHRKWRPKTSQWTLLIWK